MADLRVSKSILLTVDLKLGKMSGMEQFRQLSSSLGGLGPRIPGRGIAGPPPRQLLGQTLSGGGVSRTFTKDNRGEWVSMLRDLTRAIVQPMAIIARATAALATRAGGLATRPRAGGLLAGADRYERQAPFDWKGLDQPKAGAPQDFISGGPVPPATWEKAGKSKDKYKDNLEKLKKKKKETAKATGSLVDRIIQLGQKLRSISRLMFYASLDMQQFANVLLGPMMQGIRVFADYNKTITQMWVNFEILSQSGDAAMSLLTARFEELAAATEFSRQEIATAAAVFGTANVAAIDISESLGDMARLARINFTTIDQMAKVTLKTMRRFDLTLEETTNQMWRLTAISQQTGESIFDIANQLGYASELGQELGYTFSEITAHMILLTEIYGSASIAGRRLSSVYGNLIAKGEEYGIQIRDLNGEMLSSSDQIAGLADYLDLIADPLEQNQYLMQLFGTTGVSSARRMVDAFKEGRLDQLMEDQSDATVDALKDISDVIKDELYVSIQDLNATISDFISKLGQSLMPLLEAVLPRILDFVTTSGDWVTENKELVQSLATIAVAMAALATVMKVVGFVIEITVALATLTKGLIAAGAAIKGFFTVAAVGIGVATAPLWLIIAVIAIVIAAILLLTGFVAGLSNKMNELAKTNKGVAAILRIVNAYIHFMVSAWTAALKVILLIGMAIFGLGFLIGDIIGHLIGLVAGIEAVTWALDQVAQAIEVVVEWMDHWNNVLDDAIGGVQGFLGGFLPGSPTLAERIMEVGDALNDTLVPMREFTSWGRRLTASTGKMKAQMGFHYGESVASAMTGRAGMGGDTYITNVDGAYIQDPEELAEIIMERQTRKSRRHYRSVSY